MSKDIYERIALAMDKFCNEEDWSEQFETDREFLQKAYSEAKQKRRPDGLLPGFTEAAKWAKIAYLKMVLKEHMREG